jgi:hypothetical protein
MPYGQVAAFVRDRAPSNWSVTRPFHPTNEDRTEIARMSRLGIPQTQIAIVFGIDPKTLREHCRKELGQAIEANVKFATTLFNMATSGKNTAAAIY